MNVFIFRPRRCPSHIKSGHLPTKLSCIWPQGLFNGHIGEVYSNGSRRAQLHPALAIWLGSIGAHSHGELAEGGGREEAKEKEGRRKKE